MDDNKNSKQFDKTRIELNDLMATLFQHETEENTLIQKAYFQEYGGPA